MYRLGYATLTWTDAVDGEEFDPETQYTEPPCPKSLRDMRIAMIRDLRPVAMVCIGGMEGVEEEFKVFTELRNGFPIYALTSTGGAASILAEHPNELVRAIDIEVIKRLEDRRREQFTELESVIIGDREERPTTPYPLIMQTIVDDVAGGNTTEALERVR
jgi:hypothetical protein